MKIATNDVIVVHQPPRYEPGLLRRSAGCCETNYMIRADFHCHTHYSHDCFAGIGAWVSALTVGFALAVGWWQFRRPTR